jgi:hypothetical protein
MIPEFSIDILSYALGMDPCDELGDFLNKIYIKEYKKGLSAARK